MLHETFRISLVLQRNSIIVITSVKFLNKSENIHRSCEIFNAEITEISEQSIVPCIIISCVFDVYRTRLFKTTTHAVY